MRGFRWFLMPNCFAAALFLSLLPGPGTARGDVLVQVNDQNDDNFRQGTIYRISEATGEVLGVFASRPDLGNRLGMDFGPDGNLYVGLGPGRIGRFNGVTGEYMGDFGSGVSFFPRSSLAFGPDGNLYVVSGTAVIQRFDGTTGAHIDQFTRTPGDEEIREIDFGPTGDLFVLQSNERVLRFDGTTGALVDDHFLFDADGEEPAGFALTFSTDPVTGSHYLYTAEGGPVAAGGLVVWSGTTGAYLGHGYGGPEPTDIAVGPDGVVYSTTDGDQIHRYVRGSGTYQVFTPEILGPDGFGLPLLQIAVTPAIPEPGTLSLLLFGAGFCHFCRRRRRATA